ncbi:MAG: glucose-1-phosphate adenylyltransferase subunit GlgD [Lachnospiraceae bacterium]|nr:glucose-1-phosphate adenylyltransferase subunit GlgD [Lachnospiraceae bacterium]
MISSNSDALGIIFTNTYDSTIPELTARRSMASLPFAARYRLIDFVLSGMVNGGIDNVSLMVRENYLSLLDHLGTGKEWDLSRKNGGLNIIPPFANRATSIYSGRVDAINNILNFLKGQKEKYVVISDSNVVSNVDFKDVIKFHIEKEADITIVYRKDKVLNVDTQSIMDNNENYFTIDLDGTRVTGMNINPEPKRAAQNASINIYVMDRQMLIDEVTKAYRNGFTHFERDIFANNIEDYNIQAYEYKGYEARIMSIKDYFDESMRLIDEKNLDELFGHAPMRTKVRDDAPTRYLKGCRVDNVMAADGCVIEGEVENSVLFRGVRVGKGAKVKNSILMQDTEVKPGAEVSYVITDKDVTIGANKQLAGTDSFPVFVAKGKTV